MCVLGTKHGSRTRAAGALTSASSDSQIIFWSKIDFLSLQERHEMLIPWPLPASTVQSCPHLPFSLSLFQHSVSWASFSSSNKPCSSSSGLPQASALYFAWLKPVLFKVQYIKYIAFSGRPWTILFSVILITLFPGPHSNCSYSACVYFQQ